MLIFQFPICDEMIRIMRIYILQDFVGDYAIWQFCSGINLNDFFFSIEFQRNISFSKHIIGDDKIILLLCGLLDFIIREMGGYIIADFFLNLLRGKYLVCFAICVEY